MTLRVRLVIVAAVVIVTIAGTGLLLVRTVEQSQISQVDSQLDGVVPAAPALARPLNAAVFHLPDDHPFPKTESAVTDIYVAILSHGRRAVISSPTLVAGQAPVTPSRLQQLRRGAVSPQTVGSQWGQGQWRAVLFKSPFSSDELLVAISLSHVDATTTRLQWAMFAAGVIIVVVLIAAGIWVERLGVRPIEDVAEVADAIVAGDRSRRAVRATSGTEAGHLADAFNVMLDEQHANEDRLRQFVADASHELRTPLTVVQGFSELWNNGHLRDEISLSDAMRRIRQEAGRMSQLVDDLLLLARLESGRELIFSPVDLSALVHGAVLDAAVTHPHRHVAVDILEPCVVEGDELSLRQVVVNLTTNALIHTPTDSPIAVRTRNVLDTVLFEVVDGGPGMDPESTRHAFDRFWRANAGRPRPGTGLGLSIVAAIVSAHGGTVHMDSDTQTGTAVRIELPMKHV